MIYLDYAATTPCREEVVDAMLPYFRDRFGNASSVDHIAGTQAKRAVDHAREQVASLVGARPEEVIFTSGSTEANNIALTTNRLVITSAFEHPSVLDSLRGRRSPDTYTLIPVDADGLVDPDVLESALQQRGQRCLVSLMLVNNEVGVSQDIHRLQGVVSKHPALFHSDITQALATHAVDLSRLGLDAVSLSAHKIYGPKGVGALVVRGPLRLELTPTQYGGGHERGLRSGTLNVPGIVGFGAAAQLLKSDLAQLAQHINLIKNTFLIRLKHHFVGQVVETSGVGSTSHICSLRLVGVNNRALLNATNDNVCFSLGSACATFKNEPSYVLLALGKKPKEANETIRVSFGRDTSSDDATTAASRIAEAANGLLEMVA